ncbi:MAG: epoxyqueuosine reductase [Ruminococcus sp.]|jgi:epoxyqueuosine reductase QueG
MASESAERLQFLKQKILDFVTAYPDSHHTETKWRQPIIGVADAADPLYEELKEKISPGHSLPSEIVKGAKSVIVFFIPFAREIIKSNIPGEESSKEWDYACIETNNLIRDLCSFLYETITDMGYQASNLPPTYHYDPERLVSQWSHKSSAYIAGIGTFGIHHLLITDQGCCGRIGSVITDMELPATKRNAEEYCLYKRTGACGKCIDRCVNQAFSIDQGKVFYNRFKCNEQIYDKIVPQYPIGAGDACGKCMCGVPCAFTNPSVL